MIDQELEDWLLSLDSSLPLRQVQRLDVAVHHRKILEQHAASQPPLVEALLWLRVGMIDRPHELVQVGSQDFEKYLHGIVHRLEGDYLNAKYWFRQVRDDNLLQELSARISVEALKNDRPWNDCHQFFARNLFQPQMFVDVVEELLTQKTVSADEANKLAEISFFEWNALWQAALSSQPKRSIHSS